MSTATVPSAKGFLRVILTRPSGPCVTRSWAMGGLRTYLHRASRPASWPESLRPVARNPFTNDVCLGLAGVTAS
jgi:hypothetical protein